MYFKEKSVVRRSPPHHTLINDCRGEVTALPFLIYFTIIMSLILLFITIPPIFIAKSNMDYMARGLVRTVEASGELGSAYTSTLNVLKQETKMEPVIKWTGIKNGKVNLREPFTLELSYTLNITIINPSFTNPLAIPVPITSRMSGVGEWFWK